MPMLPSEITCAVDAGSSGVRVVAAVTAGTVTLTLSGASGAHGATGPTSTLCIVRAEHPLPFTITIAVPPGAASDLDLYERPDPDCAAGKIAP